MIFKHSNHNMQDRRRYKIGYRNIVGGDKHIFRLVSGDTIFRIFNTGV